MAKKRYDKQFYRLTPAQVLALFFFGIITVGALLLTLPFATQDGQSIGLLDAYFTSTSCICVTGLIAVDTGTTFSIFGKVVIIVLIQLGGMGIMAFATVIYGMMRRQISVSNMLVMQEALNQGHMGYLKTAITNVVKLTFLCEGVGAVLLSFRFIPMYGLLKGTGFSVFHAISAFCNAGFDLNGNFSSLTHFANDPLVLLTIAGLIITGGLGFAVIREISTKQRNQRFSLQTKIVVTMTLLLLVIGAILIFFLEYNNPATLGNPEMGLGTRILSAVFQSVTCRTAGFNSIDQGGMTIATKLVCCVLMFVGASPGSTGGGIKTTTFCLIILATWSLIRGNEDITVSNRRMLRRQVQHACSVFILGLFIVLTVTTALLLLEPGLPLEDILFEVVSGFATVGLTAGITTTLGAVSKILLMTAMFLGRVGPMTVVMAFAGTRPHKRPYKYVEEEVMIG